MPGRAARPRRPVAGAGRARIAARLRWSACPSVVLLAATLAAGCGAPRPTAGPGGNAPAPMPTVEPSTASTVTSSTAGGPGRRYVFPVDGHATYHPTHSAYPATDIFAACGTPVRAVTDGTILEVSRVDRFDEDGPRGPFNGGRFVSLLGDDGVRYYGSHLADVRAGIEAGVPVRAGQQLGAVGKTGNASNVCHLHFGISPPCGETGDWWIRRGVVWPAPFLDAWRKRTDRGPTEQVAVWHRDHGCPPAP